jgi:hypothetical protein
VPPEPEDFGGGGKLNENMEISFRSTKDQQSACSSHLGEVMSNGADISTLYREFTQALTDVLAEHAFGPASRARLARARAAVKKHSEYSEHGYFLAVETAFKQWEALQTVGHLEGPSQPGQTG